MNTEELIEIVLSDLSSKLEEVTSEAIIKANGELTKELKETILLTQKAVIVHTHAYEALAEVLTVAFKNDVKTTCKNRALGILDKASKLRGKLNTVSTAEKFYDSLAELEIVLYQLESYGVVNRTLQHT